MKAAAALRAATAAEHERVDRLFSSLNLRDAGDYRLFLLAHAAAFLPVENALDEAGAADLIEDWPQRQRGYLLEADIASIGELLPPPVPAPAFPHAASVAGGMYVLEGSRLGGKMLRRQISPAAPARFLNAEEKPGSWRKLLENLDATLYRTDLVEAAIFAARDVFQRFEAGGLRYLEMKRE